MAALHEGVDFAGQSDLPRGWAQDVFQCCTFADLDIEGAAFEGLLSDCRIENSSWYWGLFNTTKFVDVQFTDCLFRGSAFSGCVFVRCRFVNCKFTKDNLDASCSFSDCVWFACEQTGCQGLPRPFAEQVRRPGQQVSPSSRSP